MPNVVGGDQFHPAYMPRDLAENEVLVGNDLYTIVDVDRDTIDIEHVDGKGGHVPLSVVPKEVLDRLRKLKERRLKVNQVAVDSRIYTILTATPGQERVIWDDRSAFTGGVADPPFPAAVLKKLEQLNADGWKPVVAYQGFVLEVVDAVGIPPAHLEGRILKVQQVADGKITATFVAPAPLAPPPAGLLKKFARPKTQKGGKRAKRK